MQIDLSGDSQIASFKQDPREGSKTGEGCLYHYQMVIENLWQIQMLGVDRVFGKSRLESFNRDP